MEPWTPDGDFGFSEGQDDDQSSTPVAFVSTQQSISLEVDEVPDERTPSGMVCMGTFFNERLIARSIVPPEALDEVESHGLLSSPVRLGLAAFEDDPGLQCRLYALLPASKVMEDEEEPEEPWAASVPRFEDVASEPQSGEGGEEAIVPLLLGHIVRFAKDRRHPDDLAAEAADILRAILSDDRPLSDVVDKILEDL
jgi:hypothetical protein